MNVRILIDGLDAEHVSVLDRGVLYGDGLFETIRFVGGVAPLWPRHMTRLRESCGRLALPLPDATLLADEAQRVSVGRHDAVVRITLTRGVGERGYAPPVQTHATRIVAAFEPPLVGADWYAHGIRVRFGGLRLAVQPALAGIKHLNRLEQVLARAEWNDAAIAESLLMDIDGNLVGATAANVFLVRSGVVATPALGRCGVAGVARAEILEHLAATEVRAVAMKELMHADEIFLTSSVRGILPVRALPGRELAPGPVARALQSHWRVIGFVGAGA